MLWNTGSPLTSSTGTDADHLHIGCELARVVAHHHRRGGRGPRLARDVPQKHDGVLDDLSDAIAIWSTSRTPLPQTS